MRLRDTITTAAALLLLAAGLAFPLILATALAGSIGWP